MCYFMHAKKKKKNVENLLYRPLNVLRTARGGIGGGNDVDGASEIYIYIYINIGLPYKTNVNPLNRLGPRILCVPRVNQYIQYT